MWPLSINRRGLEYTKGGIMNDLRLARLYFFYDFLVRTHSILQQDFCLRHVLAQLSLGLQKTTCIPLVWPRSYKGSRGTHSQSYLPLSLLLTCHNKLRLTLVCSKILTCNSFSLASMFWTTAVKGDASPMGLVATNTLSPEVVANTMPTWSHGLVSMY